jgi:short subunit dehydrogenase-like uncharacterized protein
VKKPVVIYGASGYTGRLVAEYLREYNLPFIAAGRDAARIKDVMEKVPGIETADYEVIQVEHTVAALTELFSGASVVCNTVGPFIKYGSEVVEACLAAGTHYLDTTGEQDWTRVCDEKYGADFAKKDLLVSPSTAYMYCTSDIAANICLETPGLDTLDVLCLWGGLPTYASTQSIFTILMADHYYLESHRYVQWPAGAAFEVAVPGQHATSLAMAWGGSPHPVWYKNDARVANVKALGGVMNRAAMEGVKAIATMVEEKIKPLPPEEQRKALSDTAASVQAGMPPRENHRVNRTVDSVYASGPNRAVHCVINGAVTYKQTGVIQAFAANNLVRGKTRKTGFASACQAFGHRELLGALQSFGMVGEPIVTGHVSGGK